MTVSCAMIVRDAEATLERALESVRPHVDDLVVLDTGSVDGTMAIARRYADLVLDAEWVDDFSISRQHAYDLTRGDWIMHLDADDELHGGEHLRAGLAAISEDIGALHWRYVTGRDAHGVVTTEFWRERCTRRDWYRWSGAVHEVLIPVREGLVAREESIWVEHHGHGDGTASLQRNVRILEAAIKAVDFPEPRLLFYAGRDLVALGDLEHGLRHLSQYLLVATWTDERYIAQLLVGYIWRCRKDYNRAIDADLAALKITPTFPGAYFALAEDCYYLEQWERVLHWSRIGQSMPPPDSALFTHPADYQYGWMIFEAVALSKLGRIDEAAELTVRALQYAPDNPMHLHNARFFTTELARMAG